MQRGLGGQAVQALTWVFQYTGGHPDFNPASMCVPREIRRKPRMNEAVANAVEQLFTGEQGKQDNNLPICARYAFRNAPPDVSGALQDL